MENRCIIVSGGVFSPAPEQQPGDFVIACDRGYAYCERLGLMPDLFVQNSIGSPWCRTSFVSPSMNAQPKRNLKVKSLFSLGGF